MLSDRYCLSSFCAIDGISSKWFREIGCIYSIGMDNLAVVSTEIWKWLVRFWWKLMHIASLDLFHSFPYLRAKRGDHRGMSLSSLPYLVPKIAFLFIITIENSHTFFMSSSRPDLLDAALLRPGRLDRLLFCDFPSSLDSLDILTVFSRKVCKAI